MPSQNVQFSKINPRRQTGISNTQTSKENDSDPLLNSKESSLGLMMRQAVAQPRNLTSDSILSLQRLIGNRATNFIIQREEEEHHPLEVAPISKTDEKDDESIQRMVVARSDRSVNLIQRFTDQDVEKRAYQIWEQKGSPKDQNKSDQEKDFLEARNQLETEERANGIWEEKGKPKDQTEEQKKQDYSDAGFQLEIVKALNAINEAMKISAVLGRIKTRDAGWRINKYIFKNLSAEVKTLIRNTEAVSQESFALCSSAAEKAELLYFLGGTADWKRLKMTELGIDHNTFRESLVRLGVFETGTAGHKGGTEIDTLIATHLAAQVSNNFEARGKITGRLAVVGASEWDVIGREEYGLDWDTKKNTLNAFVDRSSDPPRIFVNKDRGNAGTAIHEGCHFWGSSARPIDGASHNLNEGVTEYFARKICSALNPVIPRTVYSKQFAVANKLVDKIGEPKVAEAFFDGTLASIMNQFILMPTNKWKLFCNKMENENYISAQGLLERGVGLKPL